MRFLFSLLSIISIHVYSFAQDVPGLYPFTSARQVTNDDIEGKSLHDLKIMRNEVFARHGHTFKSEDLKTHFGSQAWYKAATADASSLLTPIEKQNVEFIRKWETRITTTSDFDAFFEVFKKAFNKGDVDKLSDLVWLDFIASVDDFKNSYGIHEDEVRDGLADPNIVVRGEDERWLAYGEFESGVQYKFVQFKKAGCCWYIFGFVQVD